MSERRRLSDDSFVLIGSSSECRNKDDVVQEDSDDFEPEDSDDSDPEDHSHDSDVEDRKLTGCFVSIYAALSHLSFQVASSFLSAVSHLSFGHVSKRGNEIVMQSNKDGVAAQEDFEPEDDVVQEDSDDSQPEDWFETEYDYYFDKTMIEKSESEINLENSDYSDHEEFVPAINLENTDDSSEYSLPSSPSAEFPRCRNRKRKRNKYSSRSRENYVVQEDSDESNLEDSHNFNLNPTVDDYLFMFRPFKFRVDDYFLMFRFKVRECQNTSHDSWSNWWDCPYAHPGEKARRRDPRKYHYSDTACPDYQNGACRWGDACEYAHGEFECLLHPARYRRQLCQDEVRCRSRRFLCSISGVCLFAHTPQQLRVLPYTGTQTMLILFEQMIEWRKRKETRKESPVKFNWTDTHLSILHSYVLKLRLNSDFRVLSFAKLFEDEFWYRIPGSSAKDVRKVASFVRDLQDFFMVPKKHQLYQGDDNLKQEELIAVFIDFLLRLLHRREGSIISLEDGIKNLEKVLRFLLTVVGDISLMCDEEHEQVLNLLTEVAAVANESGSLVHSVVFSTFDDRIFKTMDERLDVILKHFQLLKDNIVKFSKLQPIITKTNITSKTDALNSLFIVDSLLHDLENLLNRDDDMISDVKDQMKELQQELKLSKSFIKVARCSEMEELKEYVMKIRGATCEAEYLINSFLVGDAPHWYLSIRLYHIIHKIKLVKTRIQETEKKYDDIVTPTLAKSFSSKLSLQNKRSSEVDEIIVGLDEKAIDVLHHLVSENEHLQIISIFGMPGLGKTTLAKKLYNHPSVKNHFDRCLWCVVSQTYHRKNLLIDILDSLKTELDKVKILEMEEESLMVEIHKSLKGRRYLVVMDDLWSSNAWDDLQRCFPDDQNKSRILFTNRNKDVVPVNSIIYELPPMSNERCWELLEKKVFQNEPCPSQLLKIGEKIAAKCHGVPLAIVVIAGFLTSMDKERGTWETVEGNLASYIFSDQNNPVMQILELSYKYLLDHLKPCFLYLGAFPEDTQIPIWKLLRLWIAEGFVLTEDKRSSESLAEEYLMELIDKSLVMVAKRRSDGGVKACVVHDLLREFCLKRCKEENFLKHVDGNCSIYEKYHCLCAYNFKAASHISPSLVQHARSYFGYLPKEIVFKMRLLRVLELLSMDEIDNLSKIGLLVHLRYLAIEYVPSSMGSLAVIGSLVNLEFLVVHMKNYFSVCIHSVMVKMMKLKYIKFTRAILFDDDFDSSQTNNLEFLSSVWIRNLKDEARLKCSPHLRQLNCYCNVLFEEEKREYRYPDFSFFAQLESLRMTHRGEFREVNIFKLPLSMKKLRLSYLCWPWEKISIIGGLPNLQILKLMYFAFEGKIWETRDGEFQQLRFLKLQSLDLALWNVPTSEHFPMLQQLVLSDCLFLQEIPSTIGEIATLQLIKVEGPCRKSLVESAREIEREQREYGNEELMVICADIEILDPDSDDMAQSSDEEDSFFGTKAVSRLEQESGSFFNMKYFEDQVQAGEWDEVERYLGGFTKVEDNRYSVKIFFEIRKQKYLEALDRRDQEKAVEILVKDLKVFASFNEDVLKESTRLLTLDNFRQNEQLSEYRDTKSARNIMLIELKKLIEANPLVRDKIMLTCPDFWASRLTTIMNQRDFDDKAQSSTEEI